MILKNKIVIVTGGANGIGRSIAMELAKEECKVIILDIDDKEGKKHKRNQMEKLNLLMRTFR